jgi:hypothetical protein
MKRMIGAWHQARACGDFDDALFEALAVTQQNLPKAARRR